MRISIHPFVEALTTRWSGGTTSELTIFPKQATYTARDFEFRISTASIEVDISTFTLLPNYNRLLAVLEGSLELIHDEKECISLNRYDATAFHGSQNTTSRGQARDFNVIFSSNWLLDFDIITDGNIDALKPYEGKHYLFCLSQIGTVNENRISQYDLIELETEGEYDCVGSFFSIKLSNKTS
jgi:hypothetical protein